MIGLPAVSVWFKGQNVTGIPVQHRNLAMVYQQFINFPNMSVFENIASPLRIQKLSESQLRPRVEKVADLLKLTPYMQRKPSELSGGQQQRTALARALVKGADLVLLDEPLVNLDYKLREELREELPQLFADTGATVVYATTEPHEALLMGGYTATMREGRVTQYGPTHEVFRKPHDLATAKAFSDPPLNTLCLKRTANGFEGEQGLSLQLPPFQNVPVGEYTLGFRPHHLQLQKNGKDILKLSGEVTVTEITVKAGQPLKINLLNTSATAHNLVIVKPGAEQKVGTAANEMAKSMDGYKKHFVPKVPEVLFSTPLVKPNSSYALRMKAPKEPGRYPYICTFPGHWIIMKGVLIVK